MDTETTFPHPPPCPPPPPPACPSLAPWAIRNQQEITGLVGLYQSSGECCVVSAPPPPPPGGGGPSSLWGGGVWVWVGTLAPYCTTVRRGASVVCSGGLSGSMRPDVHHCCLRDRQVKRMLCPVYPAPPRGLEPAQQPCVHDSVSGTGVWPRLSPTNGTAGVGGRGSGCLRSEGAGGGSGTLDCRGHQGDGTY